jgi:hypothetical protein
MIRQLLVTYCLLLVICAQALSQISPGELSRAHAQLEGVSNCTQCHEHGEEISATKCLACHTDIREAINARHGFHFLNTSTSCMICHKEHLGREAGITLFDKKQFDHAKTGFSLSGMHASAHCNSCHTDKNIANAALLQSLKQHPRQTFLGLQQQCVSCHADRHVGTLGTNCQNCHDAREWKPAALFAHAKTNFPLTSKHAAVACIQCHPAMQALDKTKPIFFTTKKFEDCIPCHTSPHGERFTMQFCNSCHTAEGWSIVRNFDHSKTVFPLIGKHATVACAECHINLGHRTGTAKNEFRTKEFQDCSPCHVSPHAPSFSKQSCLSCHTPARWAAMSQKPFDHSLTSFPLRGKHAQLECRQCHETTGKHSFAQSFKLLKTTCAECHKDPHKGVFQRAYANDCSLCHNEETFIPSTFTLEHHQRSRFPLTGAHTAIPCRECHMSQKKLIFSFNRMACESCHSDRHEGRFASIMKGQSCDVCHVTNEWKKILFDHTQTRFSLIGKHAIVACEDCHKKFGSTIVMYKGTSTKCGDCHADPHQGQFSEEKGEICSRCHMPVGWKNLLFDHNAQSSFALTGAHANVACVSCHPQGQQEGKIFTRYKPLATKCESCHQGKL